jgi:hypothetical protein
MDEEAFKMEALSNKQHKLKPLPLITLDRISMQPNHNKRLLKKKCSMLMKSQDLRLADLRSCSGNTDPRREEVISLHTPNLYQKDSVQQNRSGLNAFVKTGRTCLFSDSQSNLVEVGSKRVISELDVLPSLLHVKAKTPCKPIQDSSMQGITMKEKARMAVKTIKSQLKSGTTERRFYHIHQKDWQKY